MLAERGFDPRTSGLWAQHASTAPLCWHNNCCVPKRHNHHLRYYSSEMWSRITKKTKQDKNATKKYTIKQESNHKAEQNITWKKKSKKVVLAERGFDPRTSGLWAQHASTAPLCWHNICCVPKHHNHHYHHLPYHSSEMWSRITERTKTMQRKKINTIKQESSDQAEPSIIRTK